MKKVICFLMLFAAPALSQAMERVVPGQEPPAFSLPDLEGTAVSLDYFDGGPGVIIFWSTWSPRSLEMLEDFGSYHESLESGGLKVIAVNADRELLSESNRNEVARISRGLDLTFPVVFDVGLKTYAAYGVLALPTAVVLDDAGRVFYVLGGYPLTYREMLRERVLVALGGETPPPIEIAKATDGIEAEAVVAVAGEPEEACVLPRARFCQLQADRDPSSNDPGVMAVRLAVCRGDVDEAERMMRGVAKERLRRGDLRFALAGLMLLKGRRAEAEEAFRSLRQRNPGEGWGDWGLGLVALTSGDEHDALAHMEVAAAKGGVSAEAETAVLQFLSGYWEQRRSAPAEEGFLSIFRDLVAVRDCFVRQQQPG